MPQPHLVARGYTCCRHGQMHYLEGAPERAAAPPLVLLHQNPSSSQEYAGLVHEMARDRRVIAFDTPGYGMSDPPPGPLSMADYAACFSDALDALALPGPIDLYGFHTGTLLAAELAIARPDKVARVAMTGIPMLDAEQCARRLADARTVAPPTEDGREVLARMAALWDYVVSRRDQRVSLARAVAAFADKNRHFYRSSWAYEGVWSYDFDRLARVTQPVCLIQPDEDLAPVSRAAARIFPRSTIIDLPGLHSNLFEIGVAPVAAAMRDFFSACPKGPK